MEEQRIRQLKRTIDSNNERIQNFNNEIEILEVQTKALEDLLAKKSKGDK